MKNNANELIQVNIIKEIDGKTIKIPVVLSDWSDLVDKAERIANLGKLREKEILGDQGIANDNCLKDTSHYIVSMQKIVNGKRYGMKCMVLSPENFSVNPKEVVMNQAEEIYDTIEKNVGEAQVA
jgi:hypothetical protein